MKNIIYLTFVYFLVAGCKENDPNFDFKPLSDFEYQPANINEGTTVQILSFSGGPVCTNKATYYYQYIGIVKGTQDTIRILSPCQEIPEGHRLTEGNFSPWEKSSEIIDKVLKDHGERSFESENKLVVFNKQNPELESKNIKTAIGTLSY